MDVGQEAEGATAATIVADSEIPNLSSPVSRQDIEEDKISLQRVLLDAYEFHGLSDLGKAVLMFLVGLLFLFWQWGVTAASFKNTVINSMAAWDYGTDWQVMDLQKVDSMSKGALYAGGYLQSMMVKSQVLNIRDAEQHSPSRDVRNGTELNPLFGNNTLWVNEFAQIEYARLTLDLDWNCNNKRFSIAYNHSDYTQRQVECYKEQCNMTADPPTCLDPDLTLFFQRWSRITHRSKHKGNYALTVYTTDPTYQVFDYVSRTNQSVTTIDQSMGLLADIVYGSVPTEGTTSNGQACTSASDASYPPPCFFGPEGLVNASAASQTLPGAVDRRVIGKYAGELKLGIVASDRLSDQQDAAMFTLTIALAGSTSKRLFLLISTATIKTDVWRATLISLDVLYVLFTVWFIRREIARWRLCDKQNKSAALYFLYWWNWLQILSHACNLVFLFWGWLLRPVGNAIPLDNKAYDYLEYQADTFTAWLMFGIFMVFILGVSVCRFMRIHLGLKAFYGVFVESFRNMLDFAVFVLYIMFLLCAAVFAFFQISGGNKNFVDYGHGLSAMARLMFNYLSYDDFANYGLGLGQWYWTVTILFFLAVVLLVVFTFNVLLAIFISAYQNARENSLRVDFVFINLVYLRLCFCVYEFWNHYLMVLFCTWFGWPLPALVGTDADSAVNVHSSLDDHQAGNGHASPHVVATPTGVNLLRANYKTNSFMFYLTIFKRFPDTTQIIKHPTQLLFARWCVARLPEMKALIGMYTNFATLKLIKEEPQWLDSAFGDDSVASSGPLSPTKEMVEGMEEEGADRSGNGESGGEKQGNGSPSSEGDKKKDAMGKPSFRLSLGASQLKLVLSSMLQINNPPWTRRRSSRSKNKLPAADGMVTREELRHLLRQIATRGKYLSFNHPLLKFLLGYTVMDLLNEDAVDPLTDAIFNTYSYVPDLVKETEEETEEDVEKKNEQDPVYLMRLLEKRHKEEREQWEAQLDHMRALVAGLLEKERGGHTDKGGQPGGQGMQSRGIRKSGGLVEMGPRRHTKG